MMWVMGGAWTAWPNVGLERTVRVGFFKKEPRHGYKPLVLPAWNELRMFDPSIERQDFVLGQRLAQQVLDTGESDMNRVLDECDEQVRTVIPVLVNVPDVVNSPEDVAYDFATGWLLAEFEQSEGLARDGQASDAAVLALSYLRQTMPEDKGFVGDKALNAGYYCGRTHIDGTLLVSLITAGR